MLFFGNMFGIIWFLRNVPKIGFLMLGLNVLDLVAPKPIRLLFALGFLAFNIWAALKGNEYTIQENIRSGWVLVDPNDPAVKAQLTKQIAAAKEAALDVDPSDWSNF